MIERIQNDIKSAMRAKATADLNVLRALKNELSNAALRKGSINETLADIEILAIVRKEISKRQDSIKAFTDGGREELAANEQTEIEVLVKYLPEEMTEETLEEIVLSTIVLLAASSKKDMGRVIKSVVEQVNGGADNKRISSLVGKHLP